MSQKLFLQIFLVLFAGLGPSIGQAIELPIVPIKFNRYSMGGAFKVSVKGSISLPRQANIDPKTAQFFDLIGETQATFTSEKISKKNWIADFDVQLDSFTNASSDGREVFQIKFPDTQLMLLAAVDSKSQLHFSIESTLRQVAARLLVPENPIVDAPMGLAKNDNLKLEQWISLFSEESRNRVVRDKAFGFDPSYPNLRDAPILKSLANAVSENTILAPKMDVMVPGHVQRLFRLKNLEPGSVVSFYLPGRGWSGHIAVPEDIGEMWVYLDGGYIYQNSLDLLVRAATRDSKGNWQNSLITGTKKFVLSVNLQPKAVRFSPSADGDFFNLKYLEAGNLILLSELARPNFLALEASASEMTISPGKLGFGDGVYKVYQINTKGFLSRSSNSLFIIEGDVRD